MAPNAVVSPYDRKLGLHMQQLRPGHATTHDTVLAWLRRLPCAALGDLDHGQPGPQGSYEHLPTRHITRKRKRSCHYYCHESNLLIPSPPTTMPDNSPPNTCNEDDKEREGVDTDGDTNADADATRYAKASALWTPSRRKRTRVQDDGLDQSHGQSSHLTSCDHDRQFHQEDDIFATPRAPVSLTQPSEQSWSASASTTSTSNSTTGEGGSKSRGSPKKKLRNLGIRDDGIEARAFRSGHPDLPDELVGIWTMMVQTNKGIGVISPTQKDKIEEVASKPNQGAGGLLAPQQMQYMYSPSIIERDHLGPTPSIDDALDIVNWAIECQDRNAEEAAWNSHIHSRLLSLALYKDGRFRNDSLIGFSQWQVEFLQHPVPSFAPSFPLLVSVSSITMSSGIFPARRHIHLANRSYLFLQHKRYDHPTVYYCNRIY